MDIFRFTNRIRLRHPEIDPDEISQALEMEPATRWKVGEPMRGPQGKLGRFYTDSYWASEARRGEDSELLDVIDADVTELEKRAAFLEKFWLSGGRITYYVSWFASDRSGGEILPASTLGRLAALHIDLALDVYSSKSPPE